MVVVKSIEQNFSRKDAPFEVSFIGALNGEIKVGKMDAYVKEPSHIEMSLPIGSIIQGTLVVHHLRKGREIGVTLQDTDNQESGVRQLQGQVMIQVKESLTRFDDKIDVDFVLYAAGKKIEFWDKAKLQKLLSEIGDSKEEVLRFLITALINSIDKPAGGADNSAKANDYPVRYDVRDTIDDAFEGQGDLWEAWRDG